MSRDAMWLILSMSWFFSSKQKEGKKEVVGELKWERIVNVNITGHYAQQNGHYNDMDICKQVKCRHATKLMSPQKKSTADGNRHKCLLQTKCVGLYRRNETKTANCSVGCLLEQQKLKQYVYVPM